MMETIHQELITTEFIPYLSNNDINVFVLRTDKIHTVISGNKWFKLRFYLDEALDLGKKRIVTFGGAYSNHIVATAAACIMYGVKSTGIIRGEKPETLSHTLLQAKHYGMELVFISRTDYKNKLVPQELNSEENYFIAEGGYGATGAKGASTIHYNKEKFDTVCCAIGTGTMMAGLINSQKAGANIVGFSVLKNHQQHEQEISALLKGQDKEILIERNFHFGGYAKKSSALINFMNELFVQTLIPTDFVYTAKLFYGVKTLIDKGNFSNCKNLLIIHSGGLQGNLSLPKGTLMF